MKTRTVQLGEVANVERRVVEGSDCGQLAYVGLEHVESGSGNFIPEYRRKSEGVLAAKFRFTPRHVLYGKLRPYLSKVVLPDFEGVCTTEILPILPDSEKLDRTFLWGLLLSPRFVQWASLRVAGANLPRLDPGVLEEYRFPLPSLPEQRRIAGMLEQADQLRRTRRYALELSDDFLPAAFLEMFGENQVCRSKWPLEPLGSYLDAIEGGVNFNPVSEDEPASEWRVLKVSAVSSGVFRPDESKPISPDEQYNDALIVRLGDVIMSRANTTDLVGAVARVRVPPPPVLLPDKLWRLKFVAESIVLPDYALFALRDQTIRHEIEIRASGTSGSMKNISKEDAGSLRIPVPPLALQQRFADLVNQHEQLRATQRESLRQAEHLFQSLLNQAFAEGV